MVLIGVDTRGFKKILELFSNLKCAGGKISSNLNLNVQTKRRPCRWEFLFKINKVLEYIANN